MAVQSGQVSLSGVQFGPTFSTEYGVTGFQLAAGVFGGLAALIAARQLETLEREVYLSELAIPIAVAGIGTMIGASMLPSARGMVDRL